MIDLGIHVRWRQLMVLAFENWWDKYRVTLTAIEQERDSAAAALKTFVRSLGYA